MGGIRLTDLLQRQDVLAGSERVRIELRDKASGIVTGVVNLMPAMDYDIDYLQGRIVLADPLASASVLLEVAQGLLDRTAAGARPIRGIGLQLAGLVAAGESDRQLTLFRD